MPPSLHLSPAAGTNKASTGSQAEWNPSQSSLSPEKLPRWFSVLLLLCIFLYDVVKKKTCEQVWQHPSCQNEGQKENKILSEWCFKKTIAWGWRTSCISQVAVLGKQGLWGALTMRVAWRWESREWLESLDEEGNFSEVCGGAASREFQSWDVEKECKGDFNRCCRPRPTLMIFQKCKQRMWFISPETGLLFLEVASNQKWNT